jgi:membrane-bound lytic murein transglycosylase D
MLLTFSLLVVSAAAGDELRMPPPPPGMVLLNPDAGQGGADAGEINDAGVSSLEMPPPPPGMKALTESEKARLTAKADEDEEETAAAPTTPVEAPEDSDAVDRQSMELEEMKALEQVAMDPAAKPSMGVLQSLRRLGFANPLRGRMEDVLEDLELRDGELELGPVTDLASFDVSVVAPKYDIPVEMQPTVAQYIQFFQGPGRKWFRKWMSRSTRYIPRMQPVLEEHGLFTWR